MSDLPEKRRVSFQTLMRKEGDFWTQGTKIIALNLLESTANVGDNGLVPEYQYWSEALNIPKATLIDWYNKRIKIRERGRGEVDRAFDSIALVLSAEIPEILEAIKAKSYGTMSVKDLRELMRDYLRYGSLLSGRVNENPSHDTGLTPSMGAYFREKKQKREIEEADFEVVNQEKEDEK